MKAQATILLVAGVMLSGCMDMERTISRTKLLNSNGPQLEEQYIKKQMQALGYLRQFGPDAGATPKVGQAPAIVGEENLLIAREMAFGYVEARCSAYLDAIFWAHRARGTGATVLGAGGAATSAVLAATSAATTAIAVTAAGFGLATTVYEAAYDTYLYELEPSGVLGTVAQAQKAFADDLPKPTNEAQLLRQVQGYILQCSPPKIEALVNEKVKNSDVKTTDDAKPLSKEENDLLDGLLIQKTLNADEQKRLLALLERRIETLGAIASPDDAPSDDKDAADKPAAAPKASIPVTKGGS